MTEKAVRKQTVFFLFAVTLKLTAGASGGGMEVIRYNFTGFHVEQKMLTQALLENTPAAFRSHPEFGVITYMTPCSTCVELLQKRDFYSRYYIDAYDRTHFYVQQSYFPLHYRDADGILRTIDPRLKPDSAHLGLYHAPSQPYPTFYDLNNHVTSIKAWELTYRFNQKLTLFFLDSDGRRQQSSEADFSKTTVGHSGVLTTNAWNDIDIRQIFEEGGVKTDFVINKKPAIAGHLRWLVFEDEIELDEGFEIVYGTDGVKSDGGYWSGELLVRNKKTNAVQIIYERPTYFDADEKGIAGSYDLAGENGKHRVRVMVPVEFLVNPSLNYPLIIDPLIRSGRDSLGFFIPVTGVGVGADMAFTQETLGSCDYSITVNVPGKTDLIDTIFLDAEYKKTDNLCVPSPPAPSPFCKFTDVYQELVGPCPGLARISCRLDSVFGYCTSNPRRVPGANILPIEDFIPCIEPQCEDYHLTFTLRNRHIQCLEQCGYRCARGTMFAVTVQGRTIQLDVEADKDSVCVNEPVRLTSKPKYGVPPYRYVWTPSGATDTIATVYPFSSSPPQTITYIDTAYDICNYYWDADSVKIVVKPTPDAQAGPDSVLCDGDPPFQIGGNPTGPTGSSATWSALPASALNFLSDPASAYPVVAIPPGTTGNFKFIVYVVDAQCWQYDTMEVNVMPNPMPVVAADTLQICEGALITLSVTQPFARYLWSTGANTPSIGVAQSGIYTVTVENAFGCSSTANSPQLTVIQPLTFTVSVSPGTAIELGESVTLSASIDLQANPSVAHFTWSPSNFISCTNCPSPVVTPPADQQYYLTVTSTDSCVTTESVTIRVILPDTYVIPTAFSPNNDGKNDMFYIQKASGVTVKEFKIFNRWGQVLHDKATPWNGFYKDEPQEIGVYAYLFVLQLFDGREVRELGTVTLIK